MGRRPKNAPKDVPLGPPKKLTQKQFELLAHILSKSWEVLQGHELMQRDRPVVWSPKAFLRRSATKSEAATLSVRVTALEGHGLISKSGRYVRATDDGKKLLRAYLREHEQANKDFKAVKLTLELEESAERHAAICLTIETACRYGRGHVLVDGKGVLPALLEDEMGRYRHIVKQIEESYPGTIKDSSK